LSRIRLLIADDHEILRDGLQTLIEASAQDIEVVSKAADGQEVLNQIARTEPDVVLMDIRMPKLDGIEATRQIRNRYPHVKVLFLTVIGDEEFILQGMQSGASGYLLKDVPSKELLDAIRAVHNGGVHLTPEVANALIARAGKPQQASFVPPADGGDFLGGALLSSKEKEILRLLAQGLDNQAIGKRLYLSWGTVRNYISRIYELIGVHDRAQAVVWAIRHHLIDQDELHAHPPGNDNIGFR